MVIGALAYDIHRFYERNSTAEQIRDFFEKQNLILGSETSSVYGL